MDPVRVLRSLITRSSLHPRRFCFISIVRVVLDHEHVHHRGGGLARLHHRPLPPLDPPRRLPPDFSSCLLLLPIVILSLNTVLETSGAPCRPDVCLSSSAPSLPPPPPFLHFPLALHVFSSFFIIIRSRQGTGTSCSSLSLPFSPSVPHFPLFPPFQPLFSDYYSSSRFLSHILSDIYSV